MMNKPSRKWHGQTLVEFALALPILMLLAVIIFDFGRAVYYSSVVHNAAREGARYGIIHPKDDTGMEDAADKFAIGLGLDDVTVTISEGTPRVIGKDTIYYIRVNVTYTYRPVIPLIARLLSGSGGNLSLVGEAVMHTEVKP